MNRAQFRAAVRFIKRKHANQMRKGNSPAWHHVVRVSEILEYVVEKTKEGSATERRIIVLSALGHDLLEDTNAGEKEIRTVFGTRGLELIRGMTNSRGDAHTVHYVKQITRSEEAVRLIKLADLFDNITHVAYGMGLLGPRWVTSFFLPIASPMRRAVVRTRFRQYKHTAAFLIEMIEIATMMLNEELRRFQRH